MATTEPEYVEPSAVYRMHRNGWPIGDIAALLHMTHAQLGIAMRQQNQALLHIDPALVIHSRITQR